MGRIKAAIVLLTILSFSSCQIFLGPDPESSPQGIFDRIWTDFNEIYALFDIKDIDDWDKTYQIYSERIFQDMGDHELFYVCADMLNTLKDAHVSLITPFAQSYYLSYSTLYDREPFDIDVVQGYLNGEGAFEADGNFLYGTFKSNNRVGYIYIRDFLEIKAVSSWGKIDSIIESLEDTDGLVLDIRNNRGGRDITMKNIVSRFASVQKDYVKTYTKNGPGRGDFSDPVIWAVKPAGSGYAGPIVLLTNGETVSAGEWFTLALKTQDHVVHAGGPTCGALSARIVRPLINGWRYTISVQKVTDMDGNYYEEKGISPGEEQTVYNNWDELISHGRDAQLEYALSLY